MSVLFLEKVRPDKKRDRLKMLFSRPPVLRPMYESEVRVVFLPLAYCGENAQ